MLSWEDKQFLGGSTIVEHLVGLPFAKVAHRITTTDAQPSQPGSEHMIVLVTGQLIVRVLAFSRSPFHPRDLMPIPRQPE